MKKNLLAVSATALLLGASATTFAAQPYLIGQIGKSEFDTDYKGDDSDTYFSIGVGFDVSKNLAFEASYKDYGGVDGRNWSVDASSFSAAAVGKLPLNSSFELIGKVGLDLWKTDADTPFGIEDDADDDGFDLFLAFGGAFNVNSRTDITVTYELHEFDNVDVDVLAVGINYGF